MVLILDPAEPITGDFLRSLTKQNLALARLEMTWGRRGYVEKWANAALDVQRFWRGTRRRWLASVRRKARAKRRKAIVHLREAHAVLLERDPETLETALPMLDKAENQDPRCGELSDAVWPSRAGRVSSRGTVLMRGPL